MAKKYKIAIARMPGDGWESAGLVTWLMRLMVRITREMDHKDGRIENALDVVIPCDTPITMVRNRAVKQAKDAGCDYILMLDSDNIPDYLVGSDPNAKPFFDTAWNFAMSTRDWEDDMRAGLIKDGVDEDEVGNQVYDKYPPITIAAPYCGPPPLENVFIFKWKSWQSNSADPSFKLEMIEREEAVQRSGIEQVPALPTGVILFDLRVFGYVGCDPARQLEPPWFDYEFTDDYMTHKGTTEDVYTTRNASLIGLPQYVAWDSWAVHLKDKFVGKPHPITQDMVSDSLIAAVKGGRLRTQRTHFATRPPLSTIKGLPPMDTSVAKEEHESWF